MSDKQYVRWAPNWARCSGTTRNRAGIQTPPHSPAFDHSGAYRVLDFSRWNAPRSARGRRLIWPWPPAWDREQCRFESCRPHRVSGRPKAGLRHECADGDWEDLPRGFGVHPLYGWGPKGPGRILPPPIGEQGVFASRTLRPGGSRAAIARRACTRLLSGRGRFDSVGRRSMDPSPSQEGRRPFKPPGGGSNPSGSIDRVQGAGCRVQGTPTGTDEDRGWPRCKVRGRRPRQRRFESCAPDSDALRASGSARRERPPLKRERGGSNPLWPEPFPGCSRAWAFHR